MPRRGGLFCETLAHAELTGLLGVSGDGRCTAGQGPGWLYD